MSSTKAFQVYRRKEGSNFAMVRIRKEKKRAIRENNLRSKAISFVFKNKNSNLLSKKS